MDGYGLADTETSFIIVCINAFAGFVGRSQDEFIG